MQDIIPLSLLGVGEAAEVFAVSGSGAHAKRLGELGFRRGAHVRMVQPGSPCIVRLENSNLCFRDAEVSQILVCAERSA